MNDSFLNLFFEKTDFPEPSRAVLGNLADRLRGDFDRLLAFYEQAYDYQATAPLVEDLADKSGCSAYSIWMVLLILAAEKARSLYLSEEVYWDTFCDLRYKLQECFDTYGIWGNFVAWWYPIFYDGTIVKLGRMEYQTKPCPIKEPVSAFGITVNPGEPVLYMHIPASFEPFDAAARLESYKKAWAYFCKNKEPLVVICSSWLLYPGYEGVFAPGSNIADFRREFTMIGSKESESFGNCWRVFGKDHRLPTEQLPENTSLQRAFKQYMLRGGTHGSGTGVLIFDGEKLIL